MVASDDARPSGYDYPGLTRAATTGDFGFVLFRNGLVLALHSLACVAGFMAGSSLPTVAQGYTGVWRKVHERAGPLAIAFVMGATAFSLATQAYMLGHGAADLAALGRMSPALLLLGPARTRCPSCSRCSCRWRPGRSQAAGERGTSCSPRRS